MFLFLLGTIVYGVGAYCYFVAAECIGSGLAMVIFFSFPLYVVILNWLLDRQPISWLTLGSIGIILMGLTLLADYSCGPIHVSGFVYALLSGVGYALYVMVGKRMKMDPILSTFVLCLGSTVLFLLTSLLQHKGGFPPFPSNWFSAFMLGLVCTLLPILLLLIAMHTISATKASILGDLEPVTTVLVGVIFLNEMISARQWVGIAVVLAGALFVQCAPMLSASVKPPVKH